MNVEDLDKSIARRLRSRRQELGVSQSEVAEVLGVGERHVRRIETGQHPLRAGKLKALCDFLGVDAGDVFDGLHSDVQPVPMASDIMMPFELRDAIMALNLSTRRALTQVVQAAQQDAQGPEIKE